MSDFAVKEASEDGGDDDVDRGEVELPNKDGGNDREDDGFAGDSCRFTHFV